MEMFKEETEAIRVAIALGAEVPVIAGSTLYEVRSSYSDYDEYTQDALAFYSTEKEAENHILDLYYTQYSMSVKNAPWGQRTESKDGRLNLPIWDWYLARKTWFESHSFKEISDFFENKATYGSAGFRQTDLEIVKHEVSSFSDKVEYALPEE